VNGPEVLFRTGNGSMTVGNLPRVVGTFSSPPKEFPPVNEIVSDVVELRVDHMPGASDWLACAQAIQARDIPVIITIRMKAEGGHWTRPETERLALLESALPHVAAVDIELKSKLVESVTKIARRHKKACIVSFHDFEKTPPRKTLENIVRKAQGLGSIVKISTKMNGKEDARTLAGLLLAKWKVPLCVIGMGPAGAHTRVSFPLFGSCLAYAFLEKPAAPGQLSAARVVEYLTELLPEYGAERLAKRP